MNNCNSCGSSIPENQKYCSMCYGDPYYGHDGYYLKWLQDQAEEEAYNQYIESQQAQAFEEVIKEEHTASDEVDLFDPGDN